MQCNNLTTTLTAHTRMQRKLHSELSYCPETLYFLTNNSMEGTWLQELKTLELDKLQTETQPIFEIYTIKMK